MFSPFSFDDLLRIELKDVIFHSEVKVLFGSNFRGLVVAREFGRVFPELRPSVFVLSSYIYCSRKASLISD